MSRRLRMATPDKACGIIDGSYGGGKGGQTAILSHEVTVCSQILSWRS